MQSSSSPSMRRSCSLGSRVAARPELLEVDTDNSSDANQSPATYDSEVDTDDEFQARLRESYKHHSPSRSRRLARSGESSPVSNANQAPFQPHSWMSPAAGACAFVPPAQLPLLPDEAHADVPAPPTAAPRLSQIFEQLASAPAPDDGTRSWQRLDALRRDSDSSSVLEIRLVDLAIHPSEAKQSWASTQAPSTPRSDAGRDDAEGHKKPAASKSKALTTNTTKRSEKAGKDVKAKPEPADDKVEATGEEAMAAWPKDVVTLMIRNLPRSCTHLAFLEELARRGFKGLFDFIYFPYDLKKGSNVGFGFISLLKPDYAKAFVCAFDGLYLDDRMRSAGKPLRIHPASTQGYEANLECFSKNKAVTKRGSSYSPLFLPGGSWASLESGADQDPSMHSAPAPSEPPAAPVVERKVEQDPYSVTGMAFPAAPDPTAYQWMCLQAEKQQLLQELASVQETQRTLMNVKGSMLPR